MTSPNGSTTVASTPSPYSTRFKIVAVLIVALATALGTVAYLRATEETDGVSSGSGGTREFVEALTPPEGSQALQQAAVAIDLAPGWQGVLRIDGQEIPEDQLSTESGADRALNRVEFVPGPDKVIEELSPGHTCVQAQVWRSTSGRENGTRTVSWCFTVI